MADELNTTNGPQEPAPQPAAPAPTGPPPLSAQPAPLPPGISPIPAVVPPAGPVVPPAMSAPQQPQQPHVAPPAPAPQPPAAPAWPAGAPQLPTPPPVAPPAPPAPAAPAPPVMTPPSAPPVQEPVAQDPTIPPDPVLPPEPPAPAAEAPVEEKKVPWYKRELGGGKKKKAAVAAAATVVAAEAPAAAAALPAEPKVPWYKRELGGKKKAKQEQAAPVAAAAVAAATAVLPPVVDAQAAEPAKKQPFWKLELGGKKKGAAAATATAVAGDGGSGEIVFADEEKTPWYKRSAAEMFGGGDKSDKRLKQVIGLKIGASQIAAARVVNNGHAELAQIARERLDRGVVVGGELRDAETLTAALNAFFKKNRLPKKNVRLGVANNRVNVRILDIAGAAMSAKQLDNAIRFRAQEALPIAIDDAVLDYQVLSQHVSAEGELVHRVLLVVAYRDLIDRYVEACRRAGIRLVGIDLEAFALLRALAEPPPAEGRSDAAQVVVSVGHDRSTFAVSDGFICEFTRVLDWGGGALDVAIARQFNLTPSEAEPIKWAVALDNTERPLPEGLSPEVVAQAADVVRRQLQTFARELVSSLQFYQNQPGSLGIGEIVITGGTAQMPGLAAELQRLIGVVVRVGDPLAKVAVSRKVREVAELSSLSVAIGLGIEA